MTSVAHVSWIFTLICMGLQVFDNMTPHAILKLPVIFLYLFLSNCRTTKLLAGSWHMHWTLLTLSSRYCLLLSFVCLSWNWAGSNPQIRIPQKSCFSPTVNVKSVSAFFLQAPALLRVCLLTRSVLPQPNRPTLDPCALVDQKSLTSDSCQMLFHRGVFNCHADLLQQITDSSHWHQYSRILWAQSALHPHTLVYFLRQHFLEP